MLLIHSDIFKDRLHFKEAELRCSTHILFTALSDMNMITKRECEDEGLVLAVAIIY